MHAGHRRTGESRGWQEHHFLAWDAEFAAAGSRDFSEDAGAPPHLGKTYRTSLGVFLLGVGLFWAVPSLGVLLMAATSLTLTIPWSPQPPENTKSSCTVPGT